MTSERIAELFAAALELPEGERETFLEPTREESPEVRDEVLRLLAAHAEAGDFLERSVSGKAAALVESVFEPAMIGCDIGSYRVSSELGRGGMGVVYLAERKGGGFDQRVALKVVRGGPVSESVLQRFKQERQILAGMEHPGVARLLDGGLTDEGDPFFAMEYVEGEPFTDFCDQRRLTIEERVRIFVSICRTVQYAHGNLVVHRDLKPSNILVKADGTTKLLDFGIAKLLDEGLDVSETLTRDGHQALTPEYAAPEQVRGEQVTTATDVYALGVLLYRLLTGNPPYRIEGLGQLAKAVCDTEPLAPSAATDRFEPTEAGEETSLQRGLTPARLRRRLAGDLDTVVLKALRKEPERRYVSAEALADDLERHLDGLPVRARPDTVGYRTSKFIRRHRLGVAAAVLLGVSLAAGLAGTAWQARVASGERDRAEREAARAGEVKDYVLSLFEASNPAESKGATITARELLDRGADRLEEELAEQPDLQAEMLEVIGGVNLSLGEFQQAKVLFEKALSLRRGVEDNPVAMSVAARRVAQAEHYLGNFDAAGSMYRLALEIQRRELGNQAAEVGQTLNDLAVMLAMMENYEEAEPMYRESLEIQRRELGPEHPDTLDTLSNLGTLYGATGNLEAAEAASRETLGLLRKVFGEEHPDVAFEMSSLAFKLNVRGKYEESESLHREALEMRIKLLGDDHPDVGSSLSNLAAVLRAQGRFRDAETMYRKVLELDRKALGEEHRWIAIDLDNLGLSIAKQGRLDEGFTFLEEAYAMHLRLVGARNTRAATSLLFQGIVRHYQGRSGDAELLLSDALEIFRETAGPSSSKVATALGELAGVLAERGKYEEARQMYDDALEIQREVLRPGHPDLVPSFVGLGETLMALGLLEEAEIHLREALELGEKGLPEGHWRISLAESALGECLSSGGRPEARDLLVRGHENLRSTLGDWHPATRRALERLSAPSEI